MHREEDLRNEKLREQLQKTTLFKHSKEELAKICKELHLDCSGTKVELAQRLAKAKDIRLKEEVLYDGHLDSIPILFYQVRKLGKIDCCCCFCCSHCFCYLCTTTTITNTLRELMKIHQFERSNSSDLLQ